MIVYDLVAHPFCKPTVYPVMHSISEPIGSDQVIM